MKRAEDLAARFERMNLRELELRSQGFTNIAGIDEVGRGPLAGPVCVAACILHPDRPVMGLNDSKKLSPKQRLELRDEIKAKALAFSVKLIAPGFIDQNGINAAIQLATHEALHELRPQADFCLFDYVSWTLPVPGEKIVKGDNHCNCIAAASILAKVTRDRYMQKMDAEYPGYGFATNVGYGSKAHLEALAQQGPSAIHRLSYLSRILAAQTEPGHHIDKD